MVEPIQPLFPLFYLGNTRSELCVSTGRQMHCILRCSTAVFFINLRGRRSIHSSISLLFCSQWCHRALQHRCLSPVHIGHRIRFLDCRRKPEYQCGATILVWCVIFLLKCIIQTLKTCDNSWHISFDYSLSWVTYPAPPIHPTMIASQCLNYIVSLFQTGTFSSFILSKQPV